MSDKSHSAFDASPQPPNENEEASDAGEMRKGSILVIESDTEHEESSSSESELVEDESQSDNDVIHIEESEESESDHEPEADGKNDSDFEIVESKSTEKPKLTEKPCESSDEGPEVICISDA